MLKTEQGFSLLEILVAMAAGVIVLAALLSLSISLLGSGNTHLQLSRLNQEVQGIADLISRDLQRAGFHPAAMTELALSVPAPNAVAQHLVFSPTRDLYPDPATASAAHCLRVKFWDLDAPNGDQLMVRIYHFKQNTGVLRLHVHHDVQSTQPLSDLCGSGVHSGNQLISSKEIRVNQLSFRLTPDSGPQGVRSVELAMSAAYVNRPTLAQTLHRRILLRNQGGL
ncbi:prepilin-type N-terminal cleavage/methylation domain-containing protein [Oceanisphaera sp. W20_SRM_FM3]|uniref:prepilin-type N-terminal cleavage/methylation domain-containing protein n=1 Tax=Oceanisphaera sp. W20_SRM_FM3 TaxID=3240267 RepID=UPI003F946A66